jgi:hypothetical protein
MIYIGVGLGTQCQNMAFVIKIFNDYILVIFM